MTRPAAPVPPAPRRQAGQDESAALAIVEWFADRHNRPFSRAAVLSRLPEGLTPDDRPLLGRALAAVGLKSRLVLRNLRALDPIVLPALAFDRDGAPLIVLEFVGNGRLARIFDPAEGIEREVKRRQLARQLDPEILLVAPESGRAEDRLSPETLAEAKAGRGHWFWGPVRANWAGWLQVMLAALLINVLNLALPLFVLNVYDRVIPNLAFVTLWTLGIGVALAIGLDMALRLLRATVLERISRRVDLRAGAQIFRQAMNVRLLDRPGGAAGIASHIRDFEAVRDFFASATFVALIDLLFIGIFIAVLFALVGPLAWVPLLAVPLVLTLAVIAQLPIGRSVRQAQALAGKRQSVLVETMMGVETVKALNAEPVMQREWEATQAAGARINGASRFWSAFATGSTQTIQQGVSVAIICWGVYLVAEGRITVGALVAANLLAGRALAPLGTIAQTIFRAQFAITAMAALSRFMALPVEQAATVGASHKIDRAHVEFRGTGFRYPGTEVAALADISFAVAPGEVVALLGRVGSGKTTLGKLLAGLIPHDDGQILIDGHGLAQYDPADLRAAIGFLPQDPDLFTGSLRENLMMGRPGATAAEIDRALWLGGMDGFVAGLPEGLDYFVGDKGHRLSGGQRQGLALTRLMLRQPRLVFLDEPTNAMDQEMEARVTARLGEAAQTGGMGMILCTHRPSLAGIAPRFVVIDRGRKVMDGPRAEVLDRLRKGTQTRAAG